MNSHRPRKRFGQHFLTDPGAIHAIVEAIRPQPDEIIVEIGPGPGAITEPLSRRCAHLHLVELDRDLAYALRHRFDGVETVTVHEADALRFDFSGLGDRLRVVGNLPYNISTPLLFHLLEHRASIVDMHFMLQKEVVDRMAAGPGSKTYGRLSVMLGCFLYVDKLFDVDPESFEPPPAVVSAVARLMPRDDLPDIADVEQLSRLVAAAFSKRRKTLKNALADLLDEDGIRALGVDPTVRPEQVSIEEFIALSNAVDA